MLLYLTAFCLRTHLIVRFLKSPFNASCGRDHLTTLMWVFPPFCNLIELIDHKQYSPKPRQSVQINYSEPQKHSVKSTLGAYLVHSGCRESL